MCGIAGMTGRQPSDWPSPSGARALDLMQHAWPRRLGSVEEQERLARPPPARDHRPLAARPASRCSRPTPATCAPERRDLQLPGCPLPARSPGRPLRRRLGHRGAGACLRTSGERPAWSRSTACSRSRSGTSWKEAAPRARPLRREAALLRQHQRRLARVRFGSQGGPRPRRRRRRGSTRGRSPVIWSSATSSDRTRPSRRPYAAARELPLGRPPGRRDREDGVLELEAGRRPPSGRYEDYLEELESGLSHRVRRRLISDRPLGVLLSGGIDSGLTAAIAAQEADREVDAYTVAFDDQAFDESPLRPSRRRAGSGSAITCCTSSAARLDQPSSAPVALRDSRSTTSRASRRRPHFTRSRTKCVVCLTGDGGDEMFAGYSEPLLFRWLADIQPDPGGVRGILGSSAGPRGGSAAWEREGEVVQRWERFPTRSPSRSSRTTSGTAASPAAIRRCGASGAASRGWRGLPGERRRPRAALSAGQCRHAVRERLPASRWTSPRWRIRSRRGPLPQPRDRRDRGERPHGMAAERRPPKRILRDLALKFLPADVVLRPKQGFTPPLGSWMRGRSRSLWSTCCARGVDRAERALRPGQVARLLADHLAGTADHTYPLWVLASLEIWWRLLVDASATPDMPLGELSRLEPKVGIDDVDSLKCGRCI